MDKVTKRLGIDVATYQGKDVISTVHYSIKGRLIGGGRNSWLIAFQGYALKLNLAINNIKDNQLKNYRQLKKPWRSHLIFGPSPC
jgi:hypothetical protein